MTMQEIIDELAAMNPVDTEWDICFLCGAKAMPDYSIPEHRDDCIWLAAQTLATPPGAETP